LRPQYMARGEIVVVANDYLANHPELVAEAKETVLRWCAEGMFGPRGGIRTRARRAALNTGAQKTKA
jgi:7-keto-8-aminopelargonate synthetase-like enzyme